jgi:hypothetical protein
MLPIHYAFARRWFFACFGGNDDFKYVLKFKGAGHG